ncbi:hypothetical protein TI39_contig803g00007 [Zymoseptoria brevis]|uniref:Glycosyltransferase family 34 protein n=1 Tax=Zymoseptoria brevis TaxID=1047168 RepID=A0A0F4GIZ2_9PEZI|nr:hypothetical protein TI39_contig803g00007 [Zymoseptoria brevis]
MSLDRSPSPRRHGGWSSPGLSTDVSHGKVRATSPGVSCSQTNGGVTWEAAKKRSARVEHGAFARHESQNTGIYGRWKRKLSVSLPRWSHGGQEDRIVEKERLERGRIPPRERGLWAGGWQDIPRRIGLLISRRRKHLAVLLLLVGLIWWWNTSLVFWYRRTPWLGGGAKFVIILGANQGGGVMEWKGAREWAIERDSVKNKKKYAAKWGYELDIVDMSTKKRYAHEWRESWEKVDVIRNAMKKYPNAEWFWWLDLNTFIMEPSKSLQSHIFSDLSHNVYRDINIYNPLKVQHPPNGTSASGSFENYLDPESLSPVGDGTLESINLVLSQDCGGFNLGSFFVKRSQWSDYMLDMWWDPVFYEQRHMQWEHKEQDALEYLYTNQPWIRPHIAFLPQRKINAFPNGACGDDRGLPPEGCKNSLTTGLQGGARAEDRGECGVQGIHYQQKERDFMVSMAGCEWGRDCWGEMYNFRELSNRLNRSAWERFKDWLWDSWHWREVRAEKEKKMKEKAEKEQREQEERVRREEEERAQEEAKRKAEVEARREQERQLQEQAEERAKAMEREKKRAEAKAQAKARAKKEELARLGHEAEARADALARERAAAERRPGVQAQDA